MLKACFDITLQMTLPSSLILVEDSDSQREVIDIFTDTDDLMPPGIESDGYDSGRDIYFLEELLGDDFLPLSKNESSYFDHHDDSSFSRPPSEPPDVEFFYFKPDSEELISTVMNNIEGIVISQSYKRRNERIDAKNSKEESKRNREFH
uniref:Reverse transcriptase domain-containing protein n=1 Tax=Tanacetum cinerariifolium TaxID=118510 RepID=A0A6L2LP02_TANCI|nr:hypothetical protein [Tanacetum cinerariifolium]